MNQPHSNFPTADTVPDWDDASLFTVLGEAAAAHAHSRGFQSLNDFERVLACIYELISQVLNGGFGQWLFNVHPQLIANTAAMCERAGASSTSRLVKQVIRDLRDPSPFATIDEWFDYLQSLPAEQHEHFEEFTQPFEIVLIELQRSVYSYARKHWSEIRVEG